MKSILIIGGAGFIGSNLARKLLDQNYKIFIIDNLFTGKINFIKDKLDKIEFFNVDITDKKELYKTLGSIKINFVIILAAIHFIPFCNNHPFVAIKTNIMGTKNIIEFYYKNPVDLIFFASSAVVYPESDLPHKEDSLLEPNDIYSYTKIVGEDLIRQYQSETGNKAIIGRIFNVYGPNDTNKHLISEILNQIKRGGHTIKLGNLMPRRDFIQVRDISEAIIQLIENCKNSFEIYNIGTGKEYSVKEVVETIAKIINKELLIIQDETKVRGIDRKHLIADITKIKREINWTPKFNLKKGLEDLIN